LQAANPSERTLTKQKSGGKPTFPTPRLLDRRDRVHVESRSSEHHCLKSDQLKVRKVGLPPLFLSFKISIDASDLLFYYRANTGKEVIEKHMSSYHSEVAAA